MRLFVLAAAALLSTGLVTACQPGPFSSLTPVESPHTVSGTYQAMADCILAKMRDDGFDKMGTTYLGDATNNRATLIFATPPYQVASYTTLATETDSYVFRIYLAQTDSSHVLASLDLADTTDKAQGEQLVGYIWACAG